TAGELLAVWGRPAAAAEIDGRLAELDYGRWSGLSDAEIVGRFGEAALRGWRDLGKWPEGAGWGEGEPAVAERVKRFARDAQARLGPGRTAVAVSSNGLLRYFLTLVPGLFEARAAAKQLAVRTGHMGELRARTGIFELACWNVGPDEFFSLSGGPADR
ncbi:MAG TPA: histidine phosphatase family protein, partial [Myxococcaceae bacterium]|nr:histidine phosphatase family protein [Myxococcaceae bacterium]